MSSMSAEKDFEQEYAAPRKKHPSEDDKRFGGQNSVASIRRKKLVPGGLLKAELRPGGGDSKPSDGDQAREFRSGISWFKMKPGIHYGEENCPVPVPDTFPKDDELHFEIEKGYKCYDPTSKKIFISMDVTFHEDSPFFPKKSTASEGEPSEFFSLPSLDLDPTPCTELSPQVKDTFLPQSQNLKERFAQVYSRRNKVILPPPQQAPSSHHDLELVDTPNAGTLSVPSPSVNDNTNLDLDVPIALRKNTRECTKRPLYPIAHSVIVEDFGVVKKVINEGQGWETPRAPYEVKARISAQTGDGKLIFSNNDGEPMFFTFGKSKLSRGLEIGIGTMTRGERAIVYVTREYLTPFSFLPDVEGIEEVHFDVELVHFVQVRDVLGDGRMIKRRLRDGQGEFPMDCPLQDSLLHVHYTGMLLDEKNTVFYDTMHDNDGRPFEFSSGEGLVPEGFEMCVRLMLPGEISLVTCPPDYAYDKFSSLFPARVFRPLNVPEGAYVQWKIELLDFNTPKDWTGLDFKSIMDDAENTRKTDWGSGKKLDPGNRLFKEGKFVLAKAKYDKVLREFNHVHPQDDEEGKVFAEARVLDTNPGHVKALYRRGMAHMAAGDFEEARNDFIMMTKADKTSEPDATAALQNLKQKEQEAKEKARRQFKGLFDKKPGEISEAGKEIKDVKEDSNEEEVEEELDAQGTQPAEPPRPGLLSRIWPMGRRIFGTPGFERCTIL
ncbi:hypothetical protein V2J09_000431 [Rumex salicifolius]